MHHAHRLFDCLQHQEELGSVDKAMVAKVNGAWKPYSTREIKDIVNRLSAGLLAFGLGSGDMTVEGRDKVAILSKNRPEWIFLDLAVQQTGAILVPIYPTAHVNDIAFILRDANVKMVVVNDEELFLKLQPVLPDCPSVQAVFSFEPVAEARHWTDLLSAGTEADFARIPAQMEKINTEDVFTLIYTSGTTGTPKGVMLTHHNVLSNVKATLPYFPIGKNTRVISFLPLNHIFERMVTYLYLFAGASVHYAESLDTLGENIKEVRPEMFTTVPRLLEKVYEKIMAKGNEQKGIKKKLFYWAVKLGEQYDIDKPLSTWYKMQLAVANKLVFSKWREALGDSLKCIVTGAAACQVKLIRIFTAGGVPILEGYGLTETSPVICVNKLDKNEWKFGTVGPVIDGVTVKIAEDGEILCQGPNVMKGYYKRPDLTEETIIDGWLHTGDIGTLINGKFLKITDRKKEIFKTSGGKYVAPQPIENKLVESPLIEQVMVVGSGRKYAAALVVPAFNVLREKMGNALAGADNAGIAASEKVQELLHAEISRMNQNFSQVEQIKRFELLPAEWTVEGGELTPTLKLKRKVIMEKYDAVVEKLYPSALQD
ncbi:MAG: AMP-dependent synthetase/ligase [Flavisolibacter sp.]